jgi:hypothetical protein
MKNILPVIALCIFSQGSFSQNIQPGVSPEDQPNLLASNSTAKKSPHEGSAYLNDINTKAIRHFKLLFKTVTDDRWYTMHDEYRVNFTVKDIRCRADYDMNGKWLHTIRYYEEKKLPVEVRRVVVSSYLDYIIRTVEEIESPKNDIIYVIHLEGQTDWINIRVCDYKINELEKIKKS